MGRTIDNELNQMNTSRHFLQRISVLIISLWCCAPIAAQEYDTLKVMTYNLLNYPGSTSNVRNPEYRKVIRYANPDVLVVQEITSQAGVNEFLSQVMNSGQPGTYAAAPFFNGPDTDNALYYKPSKLQYISHVALQTEYRNIDGYRMRPLGASADSVDIQIYSAHLKASQGFEAERFAEADTLRNHLNALADGGCFVFAGDFNLYTSTEPAYVELTGSQPDNSGRLYDPINTPGNWHSSPSFAAVHTQSTRLVDAGDGGAIGGLDDRFDFVLLGYAFQSLPDWQYVAGSYEELGNDGAHYNQSVNNGSNGAVPDSIADALYTCSDHLPVLLEVRRQVVPGATLALLTPNGGELLYTGESYDILWTSENLSGNVTLRVNRDYPSGGWSDLVIGTANDGQYSWVATGPESVTARFQVVSDVNPTLSDASDYNLFIQNPTLTLASPNGGETVYLGAPTQISWGSVGFSGTVRIELNRSYPFGTWEVLFDNTANDGLEIWTPVGATSDVARVRISSLGNPSVGDTSDNNFSIAAPFLSLQSPNGGEIWPVGSFRIVQWDFGGLSGSVKLELNRAFPSANWETIFASEPVANGYVDWLVTGPVSTVARLRVTLLADSSYRDSSDANFELNMPSGPPEIRHDYKGDDEPGAATFTAIVTDNLPGVATQLFIKPRQAALFDSVVMTATGNPSEFVAAPMLAFGRYDYFIRAIDSEQQTDQTDSVSIVVNAECGNEVGYDDGSAESYSWSEQDSFLWAVRFTPPFPAYQLCDAEIVVAGFRPDSSHGQVIVKVLLADGPGGGPGTEVYSEVKGSIGNVVGGLPGPGGYAMRALLYDDLSSPIQIAGDFYVAIGNLPGGSEAFGIDQSSPATGRSYFYDPCDQEWIAESALHENARDGNRMIRIHGWSNEPPTVTIQRVGNDLSLNWSSTGAPYYRVYSSGSVAGPFSNLEGSTHNSTLLISSVGALPAKWFYLVVSSSSP